MFTSLRNTFGKVYKQKVKLLNAKVGTSASVYKSSAKTKNNREVTEVCGLIIQTLPSTALKINIIVNPTSIYELHYSKQDIETLKINFGHSKKTFDEFLTSVVYSLESVSYVEINSSCLEKNVNEYAALILNYKDILNVSINAPKVDPKEYYQLLMEIIEKEEDGLSHDDSDKQGQDATGGSDSHTGSDAFTFNNNNNDDNKPIDNIDNSYNSMDYSLSSSQARSLPPSLSSAPNRKRGNKGRIKARVKRNKRSKE
jgi:hypothetical protein